jgi:hypothetical protein
MGVVLSRLLSTVRANRDRVSFPSLAGKGGEDAGCSANVQSVWECARVTEGSLYLLHAFSESAEESSLLGFFAVRHSLSDVARWGVSCEVRRLAVVAAGAGGRLTEVCVEVM